MFSRIVTMRLKSNNASEITKTLEDKILPLLRKQDGFRDELFFVDQDTREAIGISLWDRKENADAYVRNGYPQVQQALTNLLDGTPQVKTYEVVNSTAHKIATKTTA